MGQIVRVLLITLLVILFSTGCTETTADTKTTASTKTSTATQPVALANYSLPESWPIPQLTLPEGSTVTVEPQILHEMDPSWPDQNWNVDFNNSANMDGVASHVESCLKPLGYLEMWGDNPRVGSTRDGMRIYFSPDKLTKISLHAGIKVPEGMPKSDFSLRIKITKTPDPMVGLVEGSSSGKLKLELIK